ncbi:hypothetical protein [Streptomyces incarnatus]|uniref:hypothetical protein n=1 Tax=Streptomyces incarnatus TaxID=665007 RepID=UPI001AD7EE92|nr:hypothetical protein [Streptomyces incarnatus]
MGKKISSVKSGPSGFTRCRLVVDGQVAVTSVIEQWESGTTLNNVAYSAHRLNPGSAKKEGAGYIVSGSMGVGHASCAKLQKEGHEIFTVIRKEHGTVGLSAMEEAITKFSDGVSASEQCGASHG